MDKVDAFKGSLKGYSWNQMKIQRLEDEIKEKETYLTGLGHKGPELTDEQKKSPLPMPYYQPGSGKSLTEKLFELDELKQRLEWQKSQYKELKLLNPTDKEMVLELFHLEISPYVVADRYGYSVSGMYKRIDSELRKVLN